MSKMLTVLIAAVLVAAAPISQVQAAPAEKSVQAEASCPMCVLIVSRVVAGYAIKQAGNRGVKILAKSAVKRKPAARRAIKRTSKKAKKVGAAVTLDYARKMRYAVRDCLVTGGGSYFAFGQLKVAIFACGTAAYGRLTK